MANHKPEGRPITCVQCGSGGGTLVKVADKKYAHKKCLPQRLD